MSEGQPSNHLYRLRVPGGQEYGPGSIDQMCQWAREGRIPMDGVLVAVDGSESMRVMDVPRLASVLSAPPTVPRGVTPAPASESGLSTLIPYQNKPALIGYYIGVFALLPAVGYLLAIPAIVLGIVGLTRRIKSPQSKGMAHAIAAIVLGVGGPLFWTLIMIFAMNA